MRPEHSNRRPSQFRPEEAVKSCPWTLRKVIPSWKDRSSASWTPCPCTCRNSNYKSRFRRSGPDVEKQVAGIRAQLAQAQREKTRIEGLLADGAATQKSLDDVTAQITVLERQLDASLSTLRSSVATVDGNSSAIEIQIAQIENQLEKCRIVTPVSGTVLASYAHAGEMAVAGKALLKVADLDNVFLRAYFTSEQLASISQGQTVKVFADFGGDSRIEYPGTITWIASESEFTPKSIQTRSSRANLVYAVKIAVKNDGRIKLGLYGEVVL